MKALGKHLVVELYGCDDNLLSDVNFVQTIMAEAARAANTIVIDSIFHKFQPHGVSGVVVIAESHLAIHTWPEHKFASMDFFTCGHKSKVWKAFEVMKKKLKATHFSVMKIQRGILLK